MMVWCSDDKSKMESKPHIDVKDVHIGCFNDAGCSNVIPPPRHQGAEANQAVVVLPDETSALYQSSQVLHCWLTMLT